MRGGSTANPGGTSYGPSAGPGAQEGGSAAWREVIASGFLARALATDDGPEVYKAAIKFAALVRRGMTTEECRRASVELILETDAELPQ